MISSACVVSALPEGEVVSCDLDGEVALLHLRRGAYYGLDPVGARVWRLLAQPRSVAQVRDALVAEFEVDASRCGRDLVALLEQMAGAKLIEVRPAQAGDDVKHRLQAPA